MLPALLADPMIERVRRESKDRRRLNAQAKVLTYIALLERGTGRWPVPTEGATPGLELGANLSGTRTTGLPPTPP